MALIQKAFSDIITFSRSSNATRVGPTGLVEYAPHNLLTYSEQFDNAAWAAASVAGSVTANATTSPNGTVSADLYVPNTSSSDVHRVIQQLTTSSGIFSVSVYIKSAGYSRAFIFVNGPNQSAVFNLSDQTVTADTRFAAAPSNMTITSVGNGWYRCSFTTNISASISYVQVHALNSTANPGDYYTGDGTSGIFIWGAQLAVGPYALDYTPTTSAAVYGPRFDYDGSGVTIVEPVSQNLVLYSQDFDNAAWLNSATTVTANSATAPDGTSTADALNENSSTDFHLRYQSGTVASGATVTASVFLKKNARQYAVVYISDGVAINYAVLFNLDTGTVVGNATGFVAYAAPTSSSISSSGNGWYRCTVTTTLTAGRTSPQLGVAISNTANPAGTFSYAGDGSSGILVWGAQLEVGSTATAYMVSGATNGFRAVPVVSGSATARGLLVEEQRTNLVTYSEQFDNAAWSKVTLGGSVSVTANAGTSPDGTVNADLITVNRSNASTQYSVVVQATSLPSSTNYIGSIYLKAATSADVGKLVSLWQYDGTNVVNSVLVTLTDTWQRYTTLATSSLPSGGGREVISVGYITTASGGGTQTGSVSFLAWGAQAEAGSFATSYIPTLASTVTRSADVASVNTLSPWFNATEGTLFAEASRPALGGAAAFACLSTDANNRIQIGNRTGGGGTARLDYWVSTLGSDQAYLTFDNTFAANTPAKIAGAYKADDFAASANGATTKTDSSGSVPAIVSLLLGANTTTPSTILNGHLRRVAFFPRRLSNAELQALTA